MDFLDPAKKRQHQIKLYIGYFLIAIAIGLLSYLLILKSSGYDYDRKSGQIVRNGLVFISSKPVKADIYINGQVKDQTSARLEIPAGKYEFVLKSKGYRDWKETINLEGGGVEQLAYPLLVPQKLTAKGIRQYEKSSALVTASRDRHWQLVLLPDSISSFDLFDLTKPTGPPTRLNLPANLLTASGSHSFKAIEWAADNQHVLIQHNFQSGSEFVVVDREDPAKSFNLNRLANIAPSSVMLRNKKFDKLYAYIGSSKTLLSVDAATGQTTSILNNVIDYKGYGANTILYASDVSKEAGKYSVNIWDGQKTYLMGNFPPNTAYRLDMAEFDNQTYAAVAPVSANKLYMYKNPLKAMKSSIVPNPAFALKIDNPQYVSFSTNSRFVSAQSGSSFAIYDLEESSRHSYTLEAKVGLEDKANWMDGHRLMLNVDGKINIFDFNQSNQQVLIAAVNSLTASFNPDFSALYSFAPGQTNGQYALTRASMVVGK